MTLEQISIQTFAYKKISIKLMMESLERAGAKKIEFYAAAPHYCHYADLPATQEEIASCTSEIHNLAVLHGVTMDCFAPEAVEYPINIASEDNGIREKSVRYFLDYMDDLASLGCSSMLITSGWGYFNKCKWAAWERSKASLKRIVARAEELGITVYLKPVSKFSSNLVNNLVSLVRMLSEVPSENLKACIDVANLTETGETITDYFNIIPDRIGYFRFYNLTDNGEITTGEGLKTVKAYFDELDECGYKGTAAFELNFEHLVNPDHYACLAFKQLNTLF